MQDAFMGKKLSSQKMEDEQTANGKFLSNQIGGAFLKIGYFNSSALIQK